MAKVTEKLQITLPKAVATQLGIGPGTELVVEAAGEVIRLRPARVAPAKRDLEARLRDFDQDTERQRERDAQLRAAAPELFTASPDRGWRREDLYADRGLRR
jgi:AbrB family looped-hinge helix DNA binding protein